MSNPRSKTIEINKDDIQIPPKDEEELALERLVFGDLENFQNNLKNTNFLDSEDEAEDEDANSQFYDSDDGTQSSEGDEDLFFIDDGNQDGNEQSLDMEVDEQGEGSDDNNRKRQRLEPQSDDSSDEPDDSSDNAWSDSEDEIVQISLKSSDKLKKLRKLETDDLVSGRSYIHKLRSQFEKIYPKPTWASKLAEEEHEGQGDSDEDDYDHDDGMDGQGPTTGNTNALLNILNSQDKFIVTKQLKLISPNKISIVRMKDANQTKRSKSGIQSLSFHQTQPLLLTGGFDKTLRIYHIDGKINNLVTSLHLKNSPIYSCQFLSLKTKDNTNLIYASGRRRYMNKWDLNSGQVEKISRMYGHEKFQKSMEYFKISSMGNYIGLTGSSGYCNILNGLTGQFLTCFKIEGTIIDFDFSNDEQVIIIINTMGEVWEFNLKDDNKKVLNRWQDESGVGITKLKIGGPKNRWLAIGSNNGIVNIYDRTTGSTKPFKTVENLITTISSLQFSPDGQLLVIASRGKRDALRLVHLPTGSVYSNWPTSGTPLGKVTAVTFLPNNQMLAIGNEAGKVTLWRLTHY